MTMIEQTTDRRYLDVLSEAFDVLLYPADNDHDCDNEGCSVEKPQCETMRARRARWLIDTVLTPRPTSMHPDRLTNPTERVYFEEWCKENERQRGVNSGFTLLEWLLCPPGQIRPDPVTFRDMQVASSVIQWLGTNCGLAFLHETDRKIRAENTDYRTITHEVFHENANRRAYPRREELGEWAHWIASRYKTTARPDGCYLEEVIRVALNRAYDAGKAEATSQEMLKPLTSRDDQGGSNHATDRILRAGAAGGAAAAEAPNRDAKR
jgi:hypothetical protein